MHFWRLRQQIIPGIPIPLWRRFSKMSPGEMADLARNAFEAISNNPDLFPDFPPDLLAAMGSKADELARLNRECDIASLRAAIAKATRTHHSRLRRSLNRPRQHQGHRAIKAFASFFQFFHPFDLPRRFKSMTSGSARQR